MEVYSWIKNSRILGAAYDKGYEDGTENYKIDETAAYQQGVNDAWDCAKKLMLASNDYDGALKGTEIKSIFGTGVYNVFKYTTPSEAIIKIRRYENKQRCDNCRYPFENPLCGVRNQHCDRWQSEQEPKTGHWFIDERPESNREIICSNCEQPIFRYHKLDFDYRPNYCPNCGAKMEAK